MAAGLESDVLVSSYIIALTSPPDARYSPLTKAPVGPAPPSSFDQVRALVLPVTPDATVTKVIRLLVTLPATHMPVLLSNTACGVKPAKHYGLLSYREASIHCAIRGRLPHISWLWYLYFPRLLSQNRNLTA